MRFEGCEKSRFSPRAPMSDTTSKSALLTSKEVAQYIRVSPRQIRELARKGEIPHYRIGKRLLFRLSDLFSSTRVERTAFLEDILR